MYIILAFVCISTILAAQERDLIIGELTENKRLALVIGNAAYQKVGELPNPVNDARAIAKTLQRLNFTVLKYENLSQSQMKQCMDEFGEKMKTYDVALFYYAGHGIQTKGLNYLVPVDASVKEEQQIEYKCVRADRVFGSIPVNKTNIVILDACRNNPFERSWSRSTNGSGLAFMQAPSGSLIAYATSPGQTASDGTGQNGLYTEILMEEMCKPNKNILQVFQTVRAKVEKKSQNELNKKQTPWESTSLKTDFYFVGDNNSIPDDYKDETNNNENTFDDTENNAPITSNTVFIQSEERNIENNTEIIKRKIATKLNLVGFTTQRNINNANYSISIDAKIDKKNNPYGTYFCWVSAYVSVKNRTNNKTLFEKEFDTEKGSSATSYDEAAQKAYKIIADKAANEIINSIQL